jgi:SAM-dependent methyltransferase
VTDAAERASRFYAYESERPPIQDLVPADARRILDLGCASGAVGAALKRRQDTEVVGVEIDPVYAEGAERRLDLVVTADIEDLARSPDLEARLGRFDCLIAGDVLEHLVDPWAALETYAALLEPGAAAVISLPNVRFWETFWQLGYHGRWPRRSEGIFDRTHLRWFTIKDAYDLCACANLEVRHVTPLMRMRPSVGRLDTLARALRHVPLVRSFLTFQYVLLARKV